MMNCLPKAPYRPPKVVLFSFVPKEDISAEVEGDFMPISEDTELMEFQVPYAVGGGRAIISGEIDVPGDWD